MVNATEMAKPFGKNVSHWLRNQSTKEFISELSALRNRKGADLVYVENGVGAWMHEDVALEFARWLSPAFAIWCNDRIKELLTQGVSTISNDDEAILHAMEVLKRRVEASKQQLQIAEAERDHYREQSAILAPKAEYTDRVLQSTSTLTINQIAQELGMTAVRLNKKLAEKGVQYKQGKTWMLHAQYRDCGYTKMRTYATVNLYHAHSRRLKLDTQRCGHTQR